MNTDPIPERNPGAKPAEGSRVVYCEKCNNRFMVDETAGLAGFLERKAVEALPGVPLPGVFEVGLVCPGCGGWYSVGYMNKTLDLARREAEMTSEPRRRSSLRGKYSRRYARFQKEVLYRLGRAALEADRPAEPPVLDSEA